MQYFLKKYSTIDYRIFFWGGGQVTDTNFEKFLNVMGNSFACISVTKYSTMLSNPFLSLREHSSAREYLSNQGHFSYNENLFH